MLFKNGLGLVILKGVVAKGLKSAEERQNRVKKGTPFESSESVIEILSLYLKSMSKQLDTGKRKDFLMVLW